MKLIHYKISRKYYKTIHIFIHSHINSKNIIMRHRKQQSYQFTSFSIFSVRPKRLKLFVLGRNEGIQPLLAIAPMCLFSNDGIVVVVESVESRISLFAGA